MYALRERLRYGIVHFAISALICAAIIFMVYKRWYTQGMAELLGVSIIVIILATTSLFVWPLLTALVVKQDKQEQRRDHRILWSIQIVFTIITLYFLAHSRIVWAVYTVDSFEIIRAQDVLYSDKVKPKPEFMVGILDEFKWLGASFSTTDKELEEKLFADWGAKRDEVRKSRNIPDASPKEWDDYRTRYHWRPVLSAEDNTTFMITYTA